MNHVLTISSDPPAWGKTWIIRLWSETDASVHLVVICGFKLCPYYCRSFIGSVGVDIYLFRIILCLLVSPSPDSSGLKPGRHWHNPSSILIYPAQHQNLYRMFETSFEKRKLGVSVKRFWHWLVFPPIDMTTETLCFGWHVSRGLQDYLRPECCSLSPTCLSLTHRSVIRQFSLLFFTI